MRENMTPEQAIVAAVEGKLEGKTIKIDGGNRHQRRQILGAVRRAKRQAKRAKLRKGKRDATAPALPLSENG